MRILSISPYPVYPPRFGGQTRIFNLAKNLSILGNNVSLAYNYTCFGEVFDGTIEGVRLQHFKTYFQDIAVWLNQRGVAPLIISYPIHKIIAPRFRGLFKGFDVVQFEQPFLASWMKEVPDGTLKVYSSQNIEVDFEGAHFDNYWFGEFYARLVRECESEALEISDIVLAVSEEDRKSMIHVYGTDPNKIFVIENGFEKLQRKYKKNEIRKELGIDLEDRVAIFIGSSTPPNVMAVRRILLDFATRNSDVLFLLVGKSSEEFNTNEKNVWRIGEVSSPEMYLAAADVGLIPINEGSGSNLKLLHYLKHGLQILSTPFGLRGYPDLKDYVIIGELCELPFMLHTEEPKNIPKEVLKKYEWGSLASKLNEVYNEKKRS